MPTHVIYPKVSLESASGVISHWLVQTGDAVQQGQILFEVENDKAAVEVESPADGVICAMTAAGTEVAVGATVAVILAAGEALAPADSPAAVAVAPPPPPPPLRVEGLRPTPLARRIARDHNISLAGLAGSGPRGRVQKRDVMAQLAAPGAATGALHHAWLRGGAGVPLVLLHGFASDLNIWRGMLAGGGEVGPVLALDLPAHGGSPRDVPEDLDAVAGMVEAALAALTTGPLLLAGHSFGGAVAARLAARGLLDLHALCLFAPAGLGPEINASFADGILRAREPASLRPWLNELVHDSAVISDAFVQVVAAQRRDSGLTDAMRAFAAQFMPDGTQAVSILGDLARIGVPVRVVFGRNDRVLPFARTGHLPGNVGLHAVAGCGHMPQLEHPALALRILNELRRGA